MSHCAENQCKFELQGVEAIAVALSLGLGQQAEKDGPGSERRAGRLGIQGRPLVLAKPVEWNPAELAFQAIKRITLVIHESDL